MAPPGHPDPAALALRASAGLDHAHHRRRNTVGATATVHPGDPARVFIVGNNAGQLGTLPVHARPNNIRIVVSAPLQRRSVDVAVAGHSRRPLG